MISLDQLKFTYFTLKINKYDVKLILAQSMCDIPTRILKLFILDVFKIMESILQQQIYNQNKITVQQSVLRQKKVKIKELMCFLYVLIYFDRFQMFQDMVIKRSVELAKIMNKSRSNQAIIYQLFVICLDIEKQKSLQQQIGLKLYIIIFDMNNSFDPFIIVKGYRSQCILDYGPAMKKRKPTPNSWTHQERLQYLKFFEQNYNLASTQASRKANKIFVKMTKYIPSRTPNQIKSHHQKLMSKFSTLDKILKELSLYLKNSMQDRAYFKLAQVEQEQEGIEQEESNQLLVSEQNQLLVRQGFYLSKNLPSFETDSCLFHVLNESCLQDKFIWDQ